jgi:hypothetical protein
MREAFESIFVIGAKFSNMNDLRDTSKQFGNDYNCPITTKRSLTGQFLWLQCRHGGKYCDVSMQKGIAAPIEEGDPEKKFRYISF